MFVLQVVGARRNVLAYHTALTGADLEELLAVYRALGYDEKALVVEEQDLKRAA